MRNYPVLLLGMAAGLAVLALDALALGYPLILYDDFQILVRSWTWADVGANLWVPANEHAMPLGRVSTGALVQLAGRPTAVPLLMACQGPLALLGGMGLLYGFVRRELGHPLYGLVALAFFGVTSVYQQAVYWFAASFSILALDTLLLALLAAQRWRQTGRGYHLILCAGWSALAPAWFASGILAGPLCCLYLLPHSRDQETRRPGDQEKGWFSLSPCHLVTLSPCHLVTLSPLLGTAAFLAVSLPLTADAILHLEHYNGRSAWQAFGLVAGIVSTGRSVVDNLALGVFGVSGVHCPVVLVPAALTLLGVLGAWWWRPVAERRLLRLGLGLILLSYVLVYSARAAWSYEGTMNQPNWGRYHLLPQLGLALVLCGGLPHWQGRRLRLDPSGALSGRQIRGLGLLIATLFLTQLPRSLAVTYRDNAAQQQTLRRVEEMDARCRAHHIAAATARAALGKLALPHCDDRENAWLLLRGSNDPRPVAVEEARRLLQP
jgi:hypothetical protein